ncbi:hypothetical protein Dred_2983 [Desulforamulus reducens MI-1]|uniref:Uncharacterized protein n=1 Tax=Desulforamulus reducens (strain ATCC BAA-1160 / DSM 100696 / MI-1) TaxID=349161 RepID=A4J8T3_DESRM|nr:hypothetical protein [Desulforamulus reducens]ABO51486.1 hypothetical protein Dred_2983 [Desulforamulus reducens MI-1]
MPMMYGYGMGWFSMIIMMLIPLALLGLVVYLAVNSGVKNALRNSAEFTPQILKLRKTWLRQVFRRRRSLSLPLCISESFILSDMPRNSNNLANSEDKKD